MKTRTLLSALALAAAGALALSACSSGGAATGSQGTELEGLKGDIGAKDFSEQFILAHLTSQLLNAHGAETVANTKLVGSANVRQALENDEFLGYWEYTGTSWITYNGNTEPVKGEEAQFEATKEADAANGIAWLDPAPLNNTYAFAIRADKAKELGVKTLSDVAALPVEEQTFCVESEFSTRDDGWPGLKAAYGIDVPDSNVALLDTGVIYTATQKGDDCNFGEVFQTDGRIPALDLVVMEDDLQFFPAYQGAFTLKQSTLDEYPEIADVLGLLTPLLTTEQMQKLNALVDVDGEDPEDVATDWLTEQGLI
ncbi:MULTISPECIES: glycine betaine ABC transporter substrate-binding protein [Agromyces]|jgi:osmoprotectant transport system substrate-binding protein|uniref:Glycine/betaine ABC transporter substrate-binding protein n=1 Tax=Agromyces mediolanus TaxID=41986 RepID=A0A918CDB4_AGRME|nr:MULTISPECIES: glycine betaine ABC transporter substrate-binding protein [Agromyces]MCD1571392.1 glycine betaine ABC transporter substrate-binding protein [Agromyces mediolanus]GGR18346.1 glycine/betaine ABC transporter substrate-binding protein [Agromyces mediolanus]GLJ71457.1 glycine/betaine ABC transporter substrate-binding protein [Agromyces mediolanus]GLU88243.1 glycine/betaine ABC transporter substrate-binding protein [Agromyces sp. NBRC 114283]